MCETRMAMRRDSNKMVNLTKKRTRSTRRNPRRGGGGPRDGEYNQKRSRGNWNVSNISEEQ